MITILVPVLNRPGRAQPLVDSIRETCSHDLDEILFLCSPSDRRQITAATRTGARVEVVPFDLDSGDYARKINYGVTITESEWLFQGADDLAFHAGWESAALAKAHDNIGVIGTNDLGNPLVRHGRHATHSLIRRSYIIEQGTIDEPGKALHEGYHHCWVDNELVGTAIARNAWVSARRSVVEHLHPIWRVRPNAQERKGTDDDTYRRGQAKYEADQKLFRERRPLWRKR